MAFLVFGKRRRDQLPPAPDDVLAANARRGAGLSPDARYAGTAVMPTAAAVASALNAVGAAPGAGAMDDYDSHLPRWRRPSLLESRKADPNRGGGAAAISLKFTGDGNAAVDGMERRHVRYGLVSLLDVPDEIRAGRSGRSMRATRSSCSRSAARTGASCARTAARAGSTRSPWATR